MAPRPRKSLAPGEKPKASRRDRKKAKDEGYWQDVFSLLPYLLMMAVGVSCLMYAFARIKSGKGRTLYD